MNQVQKNYIVSKATADTIEAVIAEKELQFLQGKGRMETHIWTIEDRMVFDILNAEFSATVKDLYADHTSARLSLKEAESALIEYALSIAPAGIREILRRGSRERITIREKLIETIMRLDTSTVPA
jgi:hypothetical protein